jgi:hypothetical protein
MRLTGNDRNHDREGRLEIYVNGQWYKICDEQLTTEQADAACQYLGYPKRYMNIKNICLGSYSRQFLLKFLYQVRKVRGNVLVC